MAHKAAVGVEVAQERAQVSGADSEPPSLSGHGRDARRGAAVKNL